ncbi:hypothetical protein RV15_GL002192 [Enterococcus silesiacus]|nr:hypothetical protein RV15_GL002192 [Enterococcus silesiacus]
MNVIGTIGLLTIINFILYINIGQDYENITVKKVDATSTPASLATKGYDVIGFINLDENNEHPNHTTIIIGPEEKLMENIRFFISDGTYSDSTGEPNFKKLDGNNLNDTRKLEPQQYLLVTAPITENIPVSKVTFDLDYKKGTYNFTSNLRSGINDKITLPMKRTLLSFLAK